MKVYLAFILMTIYASIEAQVTFTLVSYPIIPRKKIRYLSEEILMDGIRDINNMYLRKMKTVIGSSSLMDSQKGII
jgi:hypothetical protein